MGFSAFRDKESDAARKSKSRKKSNGALVEDSDDDDDDDDREGLAKMDDADDKYDEKKLGPEDAQVPSELADGVNRIRVSNIASFRPVLRETNKSQLKRAHSAEPDRNSTPETTQQPSWGENTSSQDAAANPTPGGLAVPGQTQKTNDTLDEGVVGSPLKKPRQNMDQSSAGDKLTATQNLTAALDSVISGNSGPVPSPPKVEEKPKIEEEEL